MVSTVKETPSLRNDLEVLLRGTKARSLPLPPNLLNEQGVRFVRWSHRCEDHACQIGHDDALVSKALQQYCLDVGAPYTETSDTSAYPGHDATAPTTFLNSGGSVGGWADLLYDVHFSFQRRPLRTAQLVGAHGSRQVITCLRALPGIGPLLETTLAYIGSIFSFFWRYYRAIKPFQWGHLFSRQHISTLSSSSVTSKTKKSRRRSSRRKISQGQRRSKTQHQEMPIAADNGNGGADGERQQGGPEAG